MPRNRVVRRSFGGARRSPGRLTEWFADPFPSDMFLLPANSFIILSSLTAAGLAKRPFTITRSVGMLFVTSDQAAANEEPFGAVGGMVVSDKAVATGATAVPDPVTQASSDEWFLYQQFALQQRATAAVQASQNVFTFDSRAQRKVQDGEDFVYVVANASVADGVLMQFMVRTLVKLS